MSQRELGDYEVGGDGAADPIDEAQAVAGNGGHQADVVDVDEERYPDATGEVTIAVFQVDYTIVGSGADERPILHVFGRTPENELEHIRVHEFQPYFYAPTDSLTDEKLDHDVITGTEDGYESIRGTELTKIYARTPRDVGEIRDRFDHYEADILFPNRLLIDKDIRSGVRVPERRGEDDAIDIPHTELKPTEVTAEPRINTFDIEVDDRRGFPEDGEEPIVCLTSHDSYRDEYIAWLYNAPEGDIPSPESLAHYDLLDEDEDVTVDVRAFDEEAAMLDAFIDYIQDTEPDITTGWNFSDFDAPYLLDRLEELDPTTDYDLDPDRLSRVYEVWRSDWQGPNIKGRVVFDLLYAYQRTQFSELESYRLDAVAEQELGIGKERYTGDIGDLWEQDPERLLEYNLRDVELCVEIDRKQEIIPFWQEVATFVGCKLEDATTPGDAVDMYVLHNAHGEFALPSKGQQETEDFEGGAVFDPITGVREMVSVLDLASLYPMAMVTMNASPETKVGEDYDGETYVAPNGQRFRKEPDGIMREMVDELLEEREERKTRRDKNEPGSEAYQRYDRQQAAVKVIMNCFTPDTEVLTPEGVAAITDLEIGDDVYSLDPETMAMEVKPVTETHEYPAYRGDLVDIQTSKIDFRMTPNHRMLVRENDPTGRSDDEWRFVEAGELSDDCTYEMPHGWSYDHSASLGETIDLVDLFQRSTDADIVVSDGGVKLTAQHGIPNLSREVDTDTFLAFLAWFITEGTVDRGDSAPHRITIAQEHSPPRESIVSLIDSFVDSYSTTDRRVLFDSRPLAEYLDIECGNGSETKRIPELVFEASAERKQHFLETLLAGDGRWENDGRAVTFATESTALRDDLLRLCTELGYTAHHTRDSDIWHVRVSFTSENSFRLSNSGEQSQAENGVYCVSVKDNNTLLAGRNGKYQFTGNSLYGVSGWDRFRLYDKENAAAVTATGREVIEFTERAVNELNKNVIYGDSVTGDRPIVVQDPDGIVRILPIEDLFERAGTDIDHEVVITADGAPAGSANLPKERRTMNGWKALSVAEIGHSEWQPIEQIIRHETDKPVVKLQHKFGESTTTWDHSYVIEDDGALSEASPTDVQTPLRVSGMPDIENILEIDLYELLCGYEREYEDGRGTGGITVKTKRIHANDEYVWFGHEHYDELDSTVKVKRHISLKSEDGNALLRLLGAYVTEGSASTIETTNSKYGASIAESNSAWLEQLRKDYDRLFENATANLIASDSREQRSIDYETQEGESSVTYEDQTLKLQMMNELSAVFFRELAGQTSQGKRIPSFIFHLSESRQDVFLTTVIEGDESRKFPRYSDEYADRNFDFETTSRELAAGLSMLLTQRGKNHSFKYRDEKDSYTIRTVDTYSRGRDPVLTEVDHDGYVYDLDVAANDNFVDGVGGIVLHNTDSIMLELGDELSKEDAIETSFDIEHHINSRYDEFAREELNAEFHRFEIEFEKLYRRFFQAGKKKRYAGHIIWKEGKDVDDIDITGFEYKRSDIAPITKEVQREVIERIVRGEDLEAVQSYVNDIIEEFQAGDVDLEEIGIPGGIGKRLENYDTDTAQVRGAKYANLLLGTNFNRGSKPKRLYLEKVHPSFFEDIEANNPDLAEDPLYLEFKRDPDVICFEFADQIPDTFEIDYDKMLEKTLKGPIARIFEALDISWEEVKSGQEQTGLESFM